MSLAPVLGMVAVTGEEEEGRQERVRPLLARENVW
jgi:hypothetical protein